MKLKTVIATGECWLMTSAQELTPSHFSQRHLIQGNEKEV
jgi:hypothetical protein